MVKQRNIFIWEGNDTIAITRGTPFSGDNLKSGIVKEKGWGKKPLMIKNIPEAYFSSTKNLIVNGKVSGEWFATRIMMDFLTFDVSAPKINAVLAARIDSLDQQVLHWKRKYYEEVKRNYLLTNKDKFREEIKKQFKDLGDAKKELYTFGESWGSPMTSRYAPSGTTNFFGGDDD